MANSIFKKDQTFQEAINTAELHNAALNRYNSYFKNISTTLTLVDRRFELLAQIMNHERGFINGMYSSLAQESNTSQAVHPPPCHLSNNLADVFLSRSDYFNGK